MISDTRGNPKYSDEELESLIRREFPEETKQVKVLIPSLNDHFINGNRIKAAIIKLSEGKISELAKRIEQAKQDPRDVVGYAEFPRQMACSRAELSRMDSGRLNSLKMADWKEYNEWRYQGKNT